MPPHAGHRFLIDFARAMVEDVHILVCTLPSEPIPGDLRYQWVQELAPGCAVTHITEENPAAARGQGGAIAIWADTVRAAVPGTVSHVFASEDYGWLLAAELGAQFVPVDTNRSNIPVSATMIRNDPYRHWRFIPPPVRPWFVRHVAVVGDRDLAERLGSLLNTVVVHPYKDFWQATWDSATPPTGATPLSEDMIRRGANGAVQALARQANRILIHAVTSLEEMPSVQPHLIIAAAEDLVSPEAAFLPSLDKSTVTADAAGIQTVLSVLDMDDYTE